MFSNLQGKKIAVLIALIYVVLGVLIILFPETIGSIFCWILAVGALSLAASQYWSFYQQRKVGFSGIGALSLGVISTLIGIFCIVRDDLILSFLPMVLGIVLLIDGIGKLPIAIHAFLDGNGSRILSGISLLIPLIVGIILILDPFSAAKAVIVCFGIGIAIDGILDLISAVYAIRREESEYKDIP